MKIKLNKLNKENIIFDVTPDQKKWQKQINDCVVKMSKSIKIPGFRPGNAPLKMVKDRLPINAIYNNALNSIMPTINSEVIKSEIFLDSPALDKIIKTNVLKINSNVLELSLEYEVIPVMSEKLDLSKIKFSKFSEYKENKKEINDEMAKIAKNYGTTKEKKNKTIANGDIANISYEGKIDNKLFSGGKADDYKLVIGSKTFIDNFEEQLIGCKVGDKKQVKVTFPETYYQKDLANKKAIFNVEIKGVAELEPAIFNKEFEERTKIKHSSSEKEFYKYLLDLKIREEEVKNANLIDQELKDYVIANCELNYYPTALEQLYKTEVAKKISQDISAQKISMAKWLEKNKLTNETLNQHIIKEAKNNLKVAIAYEELITSFNITITEAEIKKHIDSLTTYLGGEEKAKREYKNNHDFHEALVYKNKLLLNIINKYCIKKTKPEAK